MYINAVTPKRLQRSPRRNNLGVAISARLPRAAEHFVSKADRAPVSVGSNVTLVGSYRVRTAVTAGRIDDSATFAYTRGQCHALTLALIEATGWEAAIVCESECLSDRGVECDEEFADTNLCGCQLHHTVAVRPDGLLVDITGVHSTESFSTDGEFVCPMNEAIWEHILTSSLWRRPDMAVARTFVAPVLDAVLAHA